MGTSFMKLYICNRYLCVMEVKLQIDSAVKCSKVGTKLGRWSEKTLSL